MQPSKSDMARSCAANATPVGAHVKIPFHLLRFSRPVCVYTGWNWPWQKWHRSADTTRHHVTWTWHGMLWSYTFSLLLLQHTQVAEGVFRSFTPVKTTLQNIQLDLTVQCTFSTERGLQRHDKEWENGTYQSVYMGFYYSVAEQLNRLWVLLKFMSSWPMSHLRCKKNKTNFVQQNFDGSSCLSCWSSHSPFRCGVSSHCCVGSYHKDCKICFTSGLKLGKSSSSGHTQSSDRSRLEALWLIFNPTMQWWRAALCTNNHETTIHAASHMFCVWDLFSKAVISILLTPVL